MIANKPISIRLNGCTYKMRAGTTVPAPVLAYWTETGALAAMRENGDVIDAPAATDEPVRIENRPPRRARGSDADPV